MLTLFFFRIDHAQGLEIAPVFIELGARDRAEQIVLKNRNARAISFDLTMRQWSQKDGDDVLTATDIFIVSPPVITMKPGETRTVRILRTEPPDEAFELSYRLILEEIPLKENKVPGRTPLALVISIPLFAEPLVASAPDFLVTLAKDAGKTKYLLTVNNMGKSHARILIAQPMAAGKALNDPLPMVGYALIGHTRSWEISNSQLAGADALRVVLPGGEVRTLPVPQ